MFKDLDLDLKKSFQKHLPNTKSKSAATHPCKPSLRCRTFAFLPARPIQ